MLIRTVALASVFALLVAATASGLNQHDDTPAAFIPLDATNFSAVVRSFGSQLNANATLYFAVLRSIQTSQNHGLNSTAPWGVVDLLNAINEYQTYIPDASNAYPYLFEIGDVFGSDFWETDQTALSFLRAFVVARGQFLYSPATAAIVADWIATYPQYIRLEECIVPPTGFTSFGAFFTRSLNMSYRPIAQGPNLFVSPIDGDFENAVDDVGASGSFKIKGNMPLDVQRVLGGSPRAAAFVGGTGVILFLNAYNYHKWHAPLSGVVDAVNFAGGMYFGVRGDDWYPDFGYFYHRAILYLNCTDDVTGRQFRVAMVAVGISEVGSVVPFVAPGQVIKRGQLIGMFDYGGSAIFLAFERGVNVTFIPNLDDLQVGQAIGQISF